MQTVCVIYFLFDSRIVTKKLLPNTEKQRNGIDLHMGAFFYTQYKALFILTTVSIYNYMYII